MKYLRLIPELPEKVYLSHSLGHLKAGLPMHGAVGTLWRESVQKQNKHISNQRGEDRETALLRPQCQPAEKLSLDPLP